MSLILKLVEWRYEQLLKVFDFNNIPMFSRITNHINLSNKLVALKYISYDEKVLYNGCVYWLIKRLIWHDIINYELDKNEVLIKYLYYPYNEKMISIPYEFYSKECLLNYGNTINIRNSNNMQQLIITYYMLIDVIMNDLIIDMCYEMKKQIYNLMLISI